MMSNHEVQMVKDNMSEFNVKFHGPKDSEFHLFPHYHMPLQRNMHAETTHTHTPASSNTCALAMCITFCVGGGDIVHV